jgi:hypothetical protein
MRKLNLIRLAMVGLSWSAISGCDKTSGESKKVEVSASPSSGNSKNYVEEAQRSGLLKNLECRYSSKSGQQFVVFVDMRNDSYVLSKVYPISSFDIEGRPKSGSVQMYQQGVQERDKYSITMENVDMLSVKSTGNERRWKDTPPHLQQSYLEGVKRATEQRDREEFCFLTQARKVLLFGSTFFDHSCAWGVNVKTMEYFDNTSLGDPALIGAEEADRMVSGPCRQQNEVQLR